MELEVATQEVDDDQEVLAPVLEGARGRLRVVESLHQIVTSRSRLRLHPCCEAGQVVRRGTRAPRRLTSAVVCVGGAGLEPATSCL